jgi:hypothetical protein
VLELLDKNKEWIFSGAGITLLAIFLWSCRKAFGRFFEKGPAVHVSGAVTSAPLMGTAHFAAITVENRTGGVLFVANFFLELDSGEQYLPLVDPLTGRGQMKTRVEAGDSLVFHIPASDIISSGLPLQAFRRAAVRDSLGRVYRSSRRELHRVLRYFYTKAGQTAA